MEVENFISKTGKRCARRNVVAEGRMGTFIFLTIFLLTQICNKTNVSLYVSSSTPILYMLVRVMLIISINAINSFYGDAI